MLLASSLVTQLNFMQVIVNAYVDSITAYVLAFVKFIMPLFIYVIVFKIVLSKS
jgi:hypothetical protein